MKLIAKLGLLAAILLVPSTVMSQDCSDCDGKIDNMIMRFDGDLRSYVEVFSHKRVPLYSGNLNPGQRFTLSGSDNFRDRKSTLGPMIKFKVDGVEVAQLHTSCSVEIGPGTIAGDFVVISATSRNGGLTCPTGDIPPPPVTEPD